MHGVRSRLVLLLSQQRLREGQQCFGGGCPRSCGLPHKTADRRLEGGQALVADVAQRSAQAAQEGCHCLSASCSRRRGISA